MSKASEKRNQAFAAMIAQCHQKGIEAGRASQPQPVVLYPSGTDPKVTGERVDEGAFGFGWVEIKPATSSLCRWLKANAEAMPFGVHRGTYGGLNLFCHDFGQSHTRKLAWAREFAAVLKLYGYRAYGTGRLILRRRYPIAGHASR